MADEPEKQDDEPQGEAGVPDSPEAEAEAPDAPEEEGGDDSRSDEAGTDEDDGDDVAERAEDAETEAPEDAGPSAPESGGESGAPSGEKKKGDELPPGAELDPIALEPERELSAEEKARVEAEAEERARLEAEATAEAPEDQTVATARTPAELAAEARYMATGKRKRSIARVLITPGDGKFEINKRTLQEYFPRPLHQSTALQPLSVSGYEGTVDVRVNVQGGGIGGQAGAVRHGIARALTEIDPELRKELKRRGFLTRDARVKERRKAGLKKARKRPQFSKR
jgi:small subunit ribosomal protein S9